MANHNAGPAFNYDDDDDDESSFYGSKKDSQDKPARKFDLFINPEPSLDDQAVEDDRRHNLFEVFQADKDKDDEDEKEESATANPTVSKQTNASTNLKKVINLRSATAAGAGAATGTTAANSESSSADTTVDSVEQPPTDSEETLTAESTEEPAAEQFETPEDKIDESDEIIDEDNSTPESPPLEADPVTSSHSNNPNTPTGTGAAAAGGVAGGIPPNSPTGARPTAFGGGGPGGGRGPGGLVPPNPAQTAANFANFNPNQAGGAAAANQAPNLSRYDIASLERATVVGPVVAFFLANHLSKRRDRKIRREATKLTKEVKSNQEEAVDQRHRAAVRERELRSTIGLQQQKLDRLERTVDNPTTKAATPETPAVNILSTDNEKNINAHEHRTGPVPVAEVIASTEVAKKAAQTEEEQKREKSSKEEIEQERRRQLEWEEYKRRQEKLKQAQEEELRKSPEVAKAEADPDNKRTREVLAERRNEVKDDPAASPYSEAGSYGATYNENSDSPTTREGTKENDKYATAADFRKDNSTESAELYKKSMRAGIVVGVVTAVMGVVAYLLLG